MAESLSDSTQTPSTQDTARQAIISNKEDYDFPSKERVLLKYSQFDNLDKNRLAYLEYGWGLKLKTFGGDVFDVYKIGNDIEYYGSFFNESEKNTMRSINQDYRTSNILMNCGILLILVDAGYLFYNVGQALQGKEVPSENTVMGLTWFGIGISAGLEIGSFAKLFKGKKKFNQLINLHNAAIAPVQ